MKRPSQYEAGIELISQLLDGRISQADFERLQEMLLADADLRQVYMQCVDQEVELSFRPPEASGVVVFPNRFLKPLLLAAAALLMIALLIFAMMRRQGQKGTGEEGNPEPVAESNSGDSPPVTPGPETGLESRPPAPPVIAAQRPVPSAPEIWSFDFENGLPAGWTAEFASSNLPPGSRGAVRTITKQGDEDNTTYRQILPPMAWGVGHFAIRKDTHLHLTFKVEQSAWYEIFLMTHVADPNRSEQAMYRLADNRLWGNEGEWQTVSIPLSEFQGKDEIKRVWLDDSPPWEGEIAWQLFFSSTNSDLQLVIDEIRIDREGPGEFTVKPVN